MFYLCYNCGQNVGIAAVICPKCSSKKTFEFSNKPIVKKQNKPGLDNTINSIRERNKRYGV